MNFIKTDGAKFVDGSGNEIVLKGMGFGNSIWGAKKATDTFTEQDYKNMSDIGFNSVRCYLNATFFEDVTTPPYTYKEEGWKWLDRHMKWAGRYDIKLILNIHIAPGTSVISSPELFSNQNYQDRLVALWKAIAGHCKNEPVIAGYDIVNEPTANELPEGLDATFKLWENLEQRIVYAIREVDANIRLSSNACGFPARQRLTTNKMTGKI